MYKLTSAAQTRKITPEEARKFIAINNFPGQRPLLASNPDLSRLAAQVPQRMSAWSDLWVSLREQGRRDARVREVADLFRVGYHCVIDRAAVQAGTGGKR